MFQTKDVEKKHILFSIIFVENRDFSGQFWKIWYSKSSYRWEYKTVHELWMLTTKATNTHSVYRGKSLARPGRNQVTATEDFDFHVSYL